MNKVELVGRLTKDPDIKYGQGENSCVARFSIAVNRRVKNKQGTYDADFISCVAFGKSGEFIEKYFKKGMAIGVTGRIQTGSYTNKDGQKIYTTDVIVEEIEFVESKNAKSDSGSSQQNTVPSAAGDGFMNLPDGIDEELPFN